MSENTYDPDKKLTEQDAFDVELQGIDCTEVAVPTRRERLRWHFKRHKGAYIAGAVMFVVGGATIALIARHQVIMNDNFNVKVNSPTNNYVTQLAVRGNVGIPVRNTDTGEVFGSINRAAEVHDISRSSVQNLIKGTVDSVKGVKLEKL